MLLRQGEAAYVGESLLTASAGRVDIWDDDDDADDDDDDEAESDASAPVCCC